MSAMEQRSLSKRLNTNRTPQKQGPSLDGPLLCSHDNLLIDLNTLLEGFHISIVVYELGKHLSALLHLRRT